MNLLPDSQSSFRSLSSVVLCLLISLANVVIGRAFGQATTSQLDRPNILFFFGDNWSAKHTSIAGDPTVKTPTFDQIARQGAWFRNAFCPVPSCSPTRSCVLTGRAAHQLEEAASLWSNFSSSNVVFTQLLANSGYEVGFCGKGWSPGKYLENGWNQNPAGKEYKSFEAFLADRDKAKPFFFWDGNIRTALHQWNADPSSWSGIDPSSLKIPTELPDCRETRESLMAYYASVERVDADAALDHRLLEENGLRESTIFVYSADNGWQMPRGLANCYDSGTHVPFAIAGPTINLRGAIDEFISLTDLAPTFLELAHVPVPATMTGLSFADILRSQPTPMKRDHVFVERERHANVRRGDLSYPIRGIRTRDFLYLWNMRPDRWPAGDPQVYFAVGDFGDVDDTKCKMAILDRRDEPAMQKYFQLNFGKRPSEELFDLRNDPDQLINLAENPAFKEIKDELKGRVLAWMRQTSDPRLDPADDRWDTFPYFGGRVVDDAGFPIPNRPKRSPK